LSILFLAKKTRKKYHAFMSKNKAEEQLYLIKLLFEPDKDLEELNFPTVCKFIRETFNVSQAAMARRLGVHLSAYQYWEYGKREPSSKTAANLCIMYLQCLYIRNQTPRATEIKVLLDSMLNSKSPNVVKDKELEAICA
jgi:DNA-binding transcriptional regulator YiaG